MAFQDYAREIAAEIPKISIFLAEKAVNRGWRDIRDERAWSFLVAESVLVAPNVINAGTALVTRFSNSVVADATASIQWIAAALATPPLVARQFRVTNGGPIYNIAAFNGVDTITLDRVYQEATAPLAQYQIYRCYYAAPSADFVRFVSVYDPSNGYPLRLHWTRAEFDRRDPQRGAQGQPYFVGSYKVDATSGIPLYEMWPHPTFAQAYMCIYQRQGVDFVSATDALPAIIPESLLRCRSLYRAYQWALANAGRFPELRDVDWRYLMDQSKQEYMTALAKTKKQDSEIFLTNWHIPKNARYFMSPIDANYAQSHDVWWG